jgi:hypothetical protein
MLHTHWDLLVLNQPVIVWDDPSHGKGDGVLPHLSNPQTALFTDYKVHIRKVILHIIFKQPQMFTEKAQSCERESPLANQSAYTLAHR